MTEDQKTALKLLIQASKLAQKKGAFTIEDAAMIHAAINEVQPLIKEQDDKPPKDKK